MTIFQLYCQQKQTPDIHAVKDYQYKDINLKIRQTNHRIGNLAILDIFPAGYERVTDAYYIYNPIREENIEQRAMLQRCINTYGVGANIKIVKYDGGVCVAKRI